MSFLRAVAFVFEVFGIFAGLGLIYGAIVLWWPSALVLVAIIVWMVYLWKKSAREVQEQALRRFLSEQEIRNLASSAGEASDDFDADLPSALD